MPDLCPIGRYFTGWARHDSGGWNHQIAVISCALALAATSNRTLVLPDYIAYPRGHTISGKDEVYRFKSCVDLSFMSSFNSTPVITEEDYRRHKLRLNSSDTGRYIPALLTKPDFKHCSHLHTVWSETCVVTHRSKQYYMFDYCQKSSVYPACLSQHMEYVRPLPSIVEAVAQISYQIGPFVHLHVRRGDKGKGPETETLNILKTLSKLGHKPYRNISVWLGTDETAPGFFSSLYDKYSVYTLASFTFVSNFSAITYSRMTGDGPVVSANELLNSLRNHSLYSVQLDYLMGTAETCIQKVNTAMLKEHYMFGSF